MNDGQIDAALEQYKIIADANPDDAQTYLRMAEIYRRQGKFDLALDNLTKAESMVQDSMEVPYNRAAVYQAQGRYDDAAQVLQDLLKKTEKPDNNYSQGEKSNRALFLERLGTIYRDNNNTPLAIETFRKMLTLGDDNAERGYQQIIDSYREAKQWQQATDAAKEATEKLPNDRELKMTYAAQLSDMGQPDVALQQVKALLKGTPDDRDVYIRLAQMNSRLKRWEDAEGDLDKAAQLSTKDEDKEYVDFLRGSNYERQKKYDQAEQTFRKILVTDPQNAAVLNYLGYMLADRGMKLDESLIMVKKAVELDPANGAYLDSLGWVYFKLGKYDQAEDNLSRAAQHMGSDPTVQTHLGDLYQKTGRLKLAVAHWERAIQEWNKTIAPDVDLTSWRGPRRTLNPPRSSWQKRIQTRSSLSQCARLSSSAMPIRMTFPRFSASVGPCIWTWITRTRLRWRKCSPAANPTYASLLPKVHSAAGWRLQAKRWQEAAPLSSAPGSVIPMISSAAGPPFSMCMSTRSSAAGESPAG